MKTVTISKDTNKTVDALAGDCKYVLEDGVTITNDQIYGINALGTAAGRVIEIDGTITSANDPSGGIFLGDQNATGKGGGTIIIGETGRILNEEDAIGVIGDDSKIVNHGKINSYLGISVEAGGVSVNNSGEIIGHGQAIMIDGSDTIIHNSGALTAKYDAIELYGSHAGNDRIVNTGTMSGMQYSVDCNVSVTGDISVINRGTMNGDILFGSGNDLYNGHKGTLAGTVYGGDGNDTYVLDNAKTQISETGSTGIDTVKIGVTYTLGFYFENLVLTGKGDIGGEGNAADNHVTGNAGNNSLLGDDGNDVLSGGAGGDLLSGGIGADTFIFKTGFGSDVVSDFHASGNGHDVIDLSGVDGLGGMHQLNGLTIQDGTDVVMDFGHGDTLRLENVLKSELHFSDFIV
jgi:hypothetical protein